MKTITLLDLILMVLILVQIMLVPGMKMVMDMLPGVGKQVVPQYQTVMVVSHHR